MRRVFVGLAVCMLLVPMAMAYPIFSVKSYNIDLSQKDATTWEELEGADGNVLLSHRYNRNRGFVGRAKAIIKKAEPNTDYTLIYYGDETHNDVWPYATCITSGTTNRLGNVRMPQAEFDYIKFIDDGVDQKFWVVPSSDVDCNAGKMAVWNPGTILFETETI
jgi:hypothetical protein